MVGRITKTTSNRINGSCSYKKYIIEPSTGSPGLDCGVEQYGQWRFEDPILAPHM